MKHTINFTTGFMKNMGWLILSLSISFLGNSQSQMGSLIQNGGTDAGAMLEAYSKPFAKGFGAAMNNGWYTTGKPHDILGVDLHLNIALATVPKKDWTYNLNDLSLKSNFQYDHNNSTAQTLMGDATDGPNIDMMATIPGTTKDTIITSFKAPPGIGFHAVPLPVVQLGVGLFKKTDLMIRFLPTIDLHKYFDDINAKINFWGIGVKHDLLQWIPAASLAPIDVSLLVAYNTLKVDVGLNVQPPANTSNISLPPIMPSFDNQNLELSINGFTTALIVSKKLLFFTIHGAIGYNYSNVTLKTNGNFPVATDFVGGVGPNSTKRKLDILKDPLDRTFPALSAPKVDLGFRFTLLVFTFFADYSYSEYPVYSGGLGITFR